MAGTTDSGEPHGTCVDRLRRVGDILEGLFIDSDIAAHVRAVGEVIALGEAPNDELYRSKKFKQRILECTIELKENLEEVFAIFKIKGRFTPKVGFFDISSHFSGKLLNLSCLGVLHPRRLPMDGGD